MPNGDVRVQTAAHEIGNGVYTVLAQMAAERLGVALSVGDGRGRRLRPAAGAGRGRVEHDREHLQRGDEGLRRNPRQAVPRGVDRERRPARRTQRRRTEA